MKTAARNTLYHPDDIKNLGYTQPRSHSGPPPSNSLTPSPPYSPSGSLASRRGETRPSLPSVTPSSGGHVRSLSLGSGSLGRSEAHWLNARSKLGRYIEGDEEDYEDVFANPNDSRRCKFGKCRDCCSTIPSPKLLYTYFATYHSTFEQILGSWLVILSFGSFSRGESQFGDDDLDDDDPFAEVS